MKHFILPFLIFISFAPFSVYAQSKSKAVSIDWGAEQKESRRSTLGGVIGKGEDGIYAIKFEFGLFKITKFTIEHYDHKMKLVNSSDFELKSGKKSKFYEGSLISEGKLYLFSSFRDKKKKKNEFYVQTINLKTMRLNSDVKTIADIDFSGFARFNAGGFSYDVSRDESKILIHYNLPYKKGEKEKYGFVVFDASFNKLYSKNVKLPTRDELYDVQDFSIDDNGNIHVLGKIYNDKRKEERKGKPNYSYQVLSYFNEGETLEKYPIKVTGKYLNDMRIAIDKNGDLACGGFYSSNASFNVDGTFWLKIDFKTKEIISKNFKEFDIDFITQNLKKRIEKKIKKKEAKGKEYELYKYSLNDIIFSDDGGAVLIGEQFFVVTTTTQNASGANSTTYRYYYKDIIVIKVSKEGNIDWNSKIPKSQITTNDSGFYSSYQVSVVKDKLYFLFNDNPKNLFNEGDGKLKNFIPNRESLVVLVTVDANGKQKKEALFNSKEAEVIIRPKVGKQIDYNEAIIFGQRKKTQRLAKLNFK